MRDNLRPMILAAMFAALVGVSAQLQFRIPPIPVQFTLQVLVVVLAGALLGARWGFISMLIYLLLGAGGAPVFSGFRSGLPVILGITGGYLLSYPLAALVVGALAPQRHNSTLGLAAAMLAGLLVIYAGGAGWVMLVGGPQGTLTALQVWQGWVLPFIPYDILKVVVAALVAARVRTALKASGRRAAA